MNDSDFMAKVRREARAAAEAAHAEHKASLAEVRVEQNKMSAGQSSNYDASCERLARAARALVGRE